MSYDDTLASGRVCLERRGLWLLSKLYRYGRPTVGTARISTNLGVDSRRCVWAIGQSTLDWSNMRCLASVSPHGVGHFVLVKVEFFRLRMRMGRGER